MLQKKIPNTVQKKYTTKQAHQNTVVVLGSSKTTPDITEYMDVCSGVVRDLVLSGKNIVSGCGNSGIMGAAYTAAATYSKKNENGIPQQNLAIIAEPLWGDEDLTNCVPIAKATGEANRIEMFHQVADTFIIFPGSAGTLQEATTLISKNYYGTDKKDVFLVGRDFFGGLIQQYQQLYDTGLIKCRPDELFKVMNATEILRYVASKSKIR